MTGRAVSLQKILAAREARAGLQQRLLRRHGVPVISYTLNIAGPVKTSALLRRGFLLGKRLVEEQLRRHGMVLAEERLTWSDAGDHWLGAVRGEALALKALMVAVEEDGPFGRVLDLDVLEASGRSIRREDVSGTPRTCLLCGERAALCARSRAHPPQALYEEALKRVRERLNRETGDWVGGLAARALLYELATTPKPGLVDRANNGAHGDMDFFTFLDSASLLAGFFRDCVLLGLERPRAALLPALRYRGQRAETRMLEATGGVNTHKGMIFSLGLLCAAAGLCAGQGKGLAVRTLCEEAGALAAPLLAELDAAPVASAGLALYHSAGVTGARGEAAAGYPSVLGHGLPALEEALDWGWTLEQAGVRALLALMGAAQDTNLLKRGGVARHTLLAEEARRHISHASPPFQALRAWDKALSEEGLSPGGCADLLAVTFFLHFLGREGSKIL